MSATVRLHALSIAETVLALKVEVDGESVWVPKSVVDDDSEVYMKGNEGILVVQEWWAEREGLV